MTTTIDTNDPKYFEKLKSIEINAYDVNVGSQTLKFFNFTNTYDSDVIDSGNVGAFDLIGIQSFYKNEFTTLKNQTNSNTSTLANVQNTLTTLTNQIGILQTQMITLNTALTTLTNTVKTLSPAAGQSLLNLKLL